MISRTALLIGLLLPGLLSAQDNVEGTVDRMPDLLRLSDFVLIDRSFDRKTRRATLNWLRGQIGTANEQTEAEFFLTVAQTAAQADNGHSNASTTPIVERFGLVPIRVYWFADGPHIIRARQDAADLLGGKVIAIEDLPVAEVETKMKTYHGGTVENFRAYYARRYLFSPPILHAAGVASNPDELKLTIQRLDGENETVTLANDAETGETVRPRLQLHPAALDGEGDQWRTVLNVDDALPRYLESPEIDFHFERLENNVGYLRLRNNFGSGDTSLRDYLDSLRPELEQETLSHMIVDLRHNGGGDLTRSAGFMLDLPAIVPQGKMIALTNNETFSAAIYSAFFARSLAPERTVIVGDLVGDRTRFYAETWHPLTLPDSGYRINYSLEMHDIGEGCNDYEICHMAQYDAMSNIAIGSVEPDHVVGLTFAAYLAGEDPQLDAALALLR